MKTLSNEIFTESEMIVIVMDKLNTHSSISFYEIFESEVAQRVVKRFEFH